MEDRKAGFPTFPVLWGIAYGTRIFARLRWRGLFLRQTGIRPVFHQSRSHCLCKEPVNTLPGAGRKSSPSALWGCEFPAIPSAGVLD